MEKGNEKNRRVRKGITIGLYIIAGLFAIGAIQFIFDSDPTNDMIGSYFTLGILGVGIIIRMLKELWAGKKKAALMEILFIVVVGAVIAWAMLG